MKAEEKKGLFRHGLHQCDCVRTLELRKSHDPERSRCIHSHLKDRRTECRISVFTAHAVKTADNPFPPIYLILFRGVITSDAKAADTHSPSQIRQTHTHTQTHTCVKAGGEKLSHQFSYRERNYRREHEQKKAILSVCNLKRPIMSLWDLWTNSVFDVMVQIVPELKWINLFCV